MKRRVHLIRHGESVANKNNLKQGNEDFELSEEGVRQAELIQLPRTVWKIYSSNFKRAYQTARIISEKFDSIPVELDERLREWETFNEKKDFMLSPENRMSINPYVLRYPAEKKYWDGESYTEIANRITDFLKEKVYDHANWVDAIENDIAVVSHAAAINHIIYLMLTGDSGSSAWHYEFITNFVHLKNASVTTLVFWEAGWKVESFNVVNH